MNILQIITLSSLGGAQSVVLELSNELIKRGHSVTVVASEKGELWSLLDKNVQQYPCKYFKREISPINDLKAIFFIKKIIKRNNYDVIHLHSSKAGV
ncbi:MAG TPA: glycosyltransferase, partial [Spirochaetales bacterium]|nr:glycosyltransferase [Spirochaetales bacterium]